MHNRFVRVRIKVDTSNFNKIKVHYLKNISTTFKFNLFRAFIMMHYMHCPIGGSILVHRKVSGTGLPNNKIHFLFSLIILVRLNFFIA